VKLPQEDNPQETDDFLCLLNYLWKTEVSVNNNAAKGELTVIGTEDPETVAWVIHHYDQAQHWLPGDCDGCGKWVIERTEAYWGSHPHFCYVCLQWSVNYFELHRKWPEGTWLPGEERL